jgi:hypothetical protein
LYSNDNEEETVKSISEKFSIPESEAKTALEIENEHRDTLEKVANKEITVEQAIEKTVTDHLEENKDYYDKEKGLPAMEKRLEEESRKPIINKIIIDELKAIRDIFRQAEYYRDSNKKDLFEYNEEKGNKNIDILSKQLGLERNIIIDLVFDTQYTLDELIEKGIVVYEDRFVVRINSISTTKEQLIEKIKEADKNKITIFANVEDEDVEYYKSLGFELK